MPARSKNNLEKKPWLREYYYPPNGSRFMVLRTLYEDEKNRPKQTTKGDEHAQDKKD